jgi:hypothetical protein
MNIEKRYRSRIEYCFHAHIAYRRRGFHGVVKNLTREGMYLETNRLTIPTGNLVELSFYMGEHQWQISALVVHVQQSGLGVIFRTPQPELEREASRLSNTPLPLRASNAYYAPEPAQPY